jgi:hypothetical protein
MSVLPLIFAALLALVSLMLFAAGFRAFRHEKFFGMSVSLTGALLLMSTAALSATLSVATQGYQAFTREVVAAVVETQRTGPRSFIAHFTFPDGREATFSLAGDELYVDAHILKWKPLANFLGLHTGYELDRVAGRYDRVEDEQTRPRTVFSLAEDKPVDMFQLRRRFSLFAPLVDAEYGSATFILAQDRQRYEIRVSTTGLLTRALGRSQS